MNHRLPLAAKYYTDPACFTQDRDTVFYRSWQCVCHLSEVANSGDFATLAIVDENVFVVRDRHGKLGAFYNICRHRGHPLVEGFGRGKNVLTCPYHAWTYDLSGQLQRAPGASKTDALSCDQIQLRKLRLEVFCGFVFVNLDDDAASLSSQAPDLEAELMSFHPDLEALRFACETSIEHDSNWKISIENYNECYHCPTVHANSLTRGVLSMDGYTTSPHEQMIWHEGKVQTVNQKQYDYDLTRSPRAGDYAGYWLWPNVSLCCYPGEFFTIRQWLPINYRNTIYRYRWFSDGVLADAEVEALMHKHRSTTGAEDAVVVAKIQKGMESRAFEPGPYILGDGVGAMSEVGVRHFHDLYRKAIDINDKAD
ncbi:MAG: aromatic ring-hydroxylating dioxygenase subunit alpha [Gammaproteobacteria bacterium]|nr:aromatic ring-hydroxylating dioxygenase subunit alpha [Gammaproteobacteria bacterium]